MGIAGVCVDGNIGALLRCEPRGGELLQDPVAEAMFRLGLAFANGARGELEGFGDNMVDVFRGI